MLTLKLDFHRRWSCRFLKNERKAWFSRVDETTFVASNLEMMRFDRPVAALLDFDVAQDVLLGDELDVGVD